MKIINGYSTLIIGSGCAGYNAALCLYERGVKDVAIVTEGVHCGTSRNTGSDKQTYYKVSLAGDEGDSAYLMAKTLFNGGCVDGDNAMVEAAESVRSFLRLETLGVHFPRNEYGEFVGYKTDHDPLSRASSVGPYTSKEMTESLERAVAEKNVSIFNRILAVKVVTDSKGVCGLLGIDMMNMEEDYGIVFFPCENVVMATGGPAIIYRDSVYPLSHTGFTSLGLTAGAKLANAAEWQYGLASIDFRWNVSGTYQQVLPRYISIDEKGVEREFLNDYYDDPFEAINDVFLKGYEWPFDSRKVNGSSRIDLAVFEESKTRKVYMDFTREPSCLEKGLEGISPVAYAYLQASGALVKTPIERLKIMNEKAISLYMDHKIDITKVPLRVAVCAQHHNGGLDVDKDYQTNVKGLYAIGECAGVFGISRPGGSALNSTQVGGNRVADAIAYGKREKGEKCVPEREGEKLRALIVARKGNSDVMDFRVKLQGIMSEKFAFKRELNRMKAGYEEICAAYADESQNRWEKFSDIPKMFRNLDMLIVQQCVAAGMIYTAEHAGSRGGALSQVGEEILPENVEYRAKRILVAFQDGATVSEREVRPLPIERNLWFEKVWKEYEERRKS